MNTITETHTQNVGQVFDGGHPATILVAEDNESNFALFRAVLEDKYNIVRARNGQEAVDLFGLHKIDLILMDVNMPLLDGYEATSAIRGNDPDIPIVAVTAYAFATDKGRMQDSGFSDYVAKPINIGRLDRIIYNLIYN